MPLLNRYDGEKALVSSTGDELEVYPLPLGPEISFRPPLFHAVARISLLL